MRASVGARYTAGPVSLWVYTMNRCPASHATGSPPLPASRTTRRRSLLGAAAALLVVSTTAWAQSEPGHRVFPAQALRGELALQGFPEVLLNGRADRLAPGARIRGADNMLQTPASLAGLKLTVHYTRETGTGLLMDVWILNTVERARKPWPQTVREAQTWTFDPAAQTWKKP